MQIDKQKPVKRLVLMMLTTITLVLVGLLSANHNWSPIKKHSKADRILVEKNARRLTLFKGTQAIKTYSASLGNSPAGRKDREGDNRTPEGTYLIDSRNSGSSCHRSLHISYPDAGDRAQARRNNTSPGGDIMIHGIMNGYGWIGALHRCYDWTAGCIAVADFEMDEIWEAVPNGTKIEIRP